MYTDKSNRVGSACTIRKRHGSAMVDPKRASEPGPGQYNSDISGVRPQSAGGRIGKGKRTDINGKGTKDWPGPG